LRPMFLKRAECPESRLRQDNTARLENALSLA
jgi:hypothetical protein